MGQSNPKQMEIYERNQLAAIAKILVRNDHDKVLDEPLMKLLQSGQNTIRPDLFSYAEKWSKATYPNALEELWEEFKILLALHPDLGFVVIEGTRIADIPSFYAEINRVYMAEESWQIGSLDGFDDLLYGGFGKLQDAKKQTIIWKDIASSRAALGVTTTLAYYQEKLTANSPFNHTYFQQKLADLQAGKGQTYFDIVAEIIQSHPKIDWIY